ncbi:GM12379 [Drosophila sechellia]|uniref:GM12379 n=1 Tax=Drosophila sechellia TaxID=7238 RepID=B4I0T3_DROSE|nr:GM12379 [Drosophila sechellia]
MPKIFLIKNRLHQQQQRLLESQNLLQHKNQDDERLVPPLSPSGSGSGPSPTPTSQPPPEPQGQGQQVLGQVPDSDQQPLSLTRKRFHHRRHYFGQSRHSLDHLNQNQSPNPNANPNQIQNPAELEVERATGQVQNEPSSVEEVEQEKVVGRVGDEDVGWGAL